MGTADQTPFLGDLRHPSQRELPEAAPLFDLAKHGFDHLLAKAIATALSGSSEAEAHRVDSRPRLRLTRPGSRGLAVLLPASRHVAADVAAIQGLQIVLIAVPRIGSSWCASLAWLVSP